MAAPITFKNISATPATFGLGGGWYAITYIATWGGGSVTLERQAADGSTFVTAATAFNANGMTVVQLPPGTYKLVVATATGIYVDITAITVNTP